MKLYLKAEELNDFDTLSVERIKKFVPLENSDILELDDLLSIIQELCYECERLEEKLDDEIRNRQDNYEPISPYKMYGVSERDFH